MKPAFEARDMPSDDKAKTDARRMAALGTYAGVITWSRSADLVNGEFGEPVVLFQHGDVPELEWLWPLPAARTSANASQHGLGGWAWQTF